MRSGRLSSPCGGGAAGRQPLDTGPTRANGGLLTQAPTRHRNWWLSAAIIGVIVVAGWGATVALNVWAKAGPAPNASLLRFHVVANSDTAQDQAVKLAVRDRVLQATDSLLAPAKTAAQARTLAAEHISLIEAAANAVLARAGEPYRARAVVGDFDFPVKRYGDLVLPAGEYPAVRVLLGKAQGHNWWCVLFPPLCLRDFDSGFAISRLGTVSAKGQLAAYAKGKKSTSRVPRIRFALRSLERQTNPAGSHLAMGAPRATKAQGARSSRR